MSEKKTSQQARKSEVSVSRSPMDVGLLEQIVKLMQANDLSSVDLSEGDKRVALQRGPLHPPAAPSHPIVAHTSPAAGPAHVVSAVPVDEDAGLLPIKSPMVGTFYAATSPDAKPLVSVGSVVDEETDVCIIEAMKVFNNIKAECRGTIAKILITNGQTVEFGQALYLVKPS